MGISARWGISQVAAAGDEVGQADVRLGSRRTVPLVAQQNITIGGPRGVQDGLTAHIVYGPDGGTAEAMRESIASGLNERFGIRKATLQLEASSCEQTVTHDAPP